jgi:hypothetical protein
MKVDAEPYPPVTVETTGRTDIEEMFRSTGMLEDRRWPHTPFLAFVVSEQTVAVRIIETPAELWALDPRTPMMVQWRGNWRSDFLQLTAGQAQEALAARQVRYGR